MNTELSLSIDPQLKHQYEADLRAIIRKVKTYYPDFSPDNKKKITRAFWYAANAHGGQSRRSGEPYFYHPIASAKILLSIKPDIQTICACLLHDVIEDTPTTADEIEECFDQDIRFLCEGVEKVSKVRYQGKERSIESLRRLFVAMASDIRAIFVKLADRIHNLQTLKHVPESKSRRIAEESFEIYLPVAEKLGLFIFRDMMEDLCFEYLHANAFHYMQEATRIPIAAQQKSIHKSIKAIRQLLCDNHVSIIDISGRTKGLFSIYRKMKRKNIHNPADIYDLLAIRIIVPNKTDCYKALGLMHITWSPMTRRFKDYIAVPKQNGYRGIHTTLLGLGNLSMPTEIQIRTQKMHVDNEYGPAAHWLYKKYHTSHRFKRDYIQHAHWIPKSVQRLKHESADDFFKALSESVLEDEIYVFNVDGGVVMLPKNATPVDFAYAISRKVGDSCMMAIVDGEAKSLDYILSSEQVVKIMTRPGKKPSRSWLDFVKSSEAKKYIRESFQEEIPKLIKNLKPDVDTDQKSVKPSRALKKKTVKRGVVIGETPNLPHKTHICIKESTVNIVAYGTHGKHFVLHSIDCSAVENLNPEKLIDAYFATPKCISITAHNKHGIVRDFLDIIYKNGAHLANIRLQRFHQTHRLNCILDITISQEYDLENITHQLKKIGEVSQVKVRNS